MFEFYVSKIVFSGGQELPLRPNSLNILIGPNSSGKSTALKEISTLELGNQHNKLVIKETHVQCNNADEIGEWAESSFIIVSRPGDNTYIATKDNMKLVSTLGDFKPNQGYGQYIHYLRNYLDTSKRLSTANNTAAIDLQRDSPKNYVHLMQLDDNLYKEISSLVNEAFGDDLIIDWSAGSTVLLKFGKEPERTKEHDRVSARYRNEITKLPLLTTLGDGIRSFVGAVLSFKCGKHPIMLIDEPEAFLHPQQIRKMGALLAKSTKDVNRQFIVATHSSEIIRGALSV